MPRPRPAVAQEMAALKTPAAPAPPAANAHGATIALLQQHSLTTLVQRELQRQIVGGALAAGSKLNEADIAAQLRVSRGPVREAFRALEQSGLVRTEKNRGVYVRQLSMAEADEIYEVRAALDGMIGRLAAQRIQPAQLQQLARHHQAHAPGRQLARCRSLFPAQPAVPRLCSPKRPATRRCWRTTGASSTN